LHFRHSPEAAYEMSFGRVTAPHSMVSGDSPSLSVLGFHLHFAWSKGDHVGVDVFFVLSGFLITSLLLEEWTGTGRIDLRAFFARRSPPAARCA
jgi:hypothetical protein